MIGIRIQLFLAASALCLPLCAQKIHIEQYLVDQKIAEVLDEHSDIIAQKLLEVDSGSKKHGVWRFDWLPDYYIKYGIARIVGLEKMKEAMERCHLSSLTVANKRVYHVKGTPTTLSNRNYAIVIQKVHAARKLPPITGKEMKQLCRLMHETGYISMAGPRNRKGPNYIRTTDGKFCFIDTESRYESDHLLKGFLRLIRTHDFTKDLSKEALQLVFLEVKQLLKQSPSEISSTLAEIQQYIDEKETPPSWDYRTYFAEYFKDLMGRAKAR